MSLARPMASIAYRPRVLTPSWMILLAWLYSIIQFLPTFYFAEVRAITLHENKTVYYCATVPNITWPGIAYLIFLALASFPLPLLTMSILYYKVARVVWRRHRNLSFSSAISGNTTSLKLLVRSRKSHASIAYCCIGFSHLLGAICDLLLFLGKKSEGIS